MGEFDSQSLPLIQTKLYRPPVPIDLVPRPHLTEWLDQRRQRPLTLISAPAGYGKSTLISSLLDAFEYPPNWIPKDEFDIDLIIFLPQSLSGSARPSLKADSPAW